MFVDDVLEVLELAHVADTLISRVSGGQRKRVNIGMELVAAPSALFLDEPTSGVDSTAALKIANILKRVAQTIGITVVAVIHQPRREIYEAFDDLLMIAPGGRTSYMSAVSKCVNYFKCLGFYFDRGDNPSDTLMDIVSGKGDRVNPGLLPDDEQDVLECMDSLNPHDKSVFIKYDVAELVEAWEVQETDDAREACARPMQHHKLKSQAVISTVNGPQMSPPASDSSSSKSLKSHERLLRACRMRGAGPIQQLWLVHNRSLLQ